MTGSCKIPGMRKRRLLLKRDTVKTLSGEGLREAAGGGAGTETCVCEKPATETCGCQTLHAGCHDTIDRVSTISRNKGTNTVCGDCGSVPRGWK